MERREGGPLSVESSASRRDPSALYLGGGENGNSMALADIWQDIARKLGGHGNIRRNPARNLCRGWRASGMATSIEHQRGQAWRLDIQAEENFRRRQRPIEKA